MAATKHHQSPELGGRGAAASPEASSEWVRLPRGNTSHRGPDFWGQIFNKYQSVQRLVRKDIDGNAEMTGY